MRLNLDEAYSLQNELTPLYGNIATRPKSTKGKRKPATCEGSGLWEIKMVNAYLRRRSTRARPPRPSRAVEEGSGTATMSKLKAL